MRNLIWFREDLRIHDNPALYYASKVSKNGLIALYIFDIQSIKKHGVANCRIEFTLRGLKELRSDLKKINIPLIVIKINDSTSLPKKIYKIIKNVKASALYFNRQYEHDEKKRDSTVEDYLKKQAINCHSFDDQMILTPNSILTKGDTYYKVFTPYKRAWEKFFLENPIHLLPSPKKQKKTSIQPSEVSISSLFKSTIDLANWPAGEKNAKKRLVYFIKNKLFHYSRDRNYPALNATSRLSPYLATGMISARQCFLAAFKKNKYELHSGQKGALVWMAELVWRDFYKQILISVPRVSMNQPYQLVTEKIRWKTNKKLLKAWQEGKTGFPIIDAAMRQLNQTGWMHNRLRMITAMFLTKNLLIDWRLGEEYFMKHLIDGDLSANNGGWQWCASTGTDAVPYFRIFNPITQSKKFDPRGEFILRYCPELARLNVRNLHQPQNPIINLNASRNYAIQVFKSIKQSK